ncbi:hypothetical protein MVES1_001018 [Malassezia vespertilionis]|uniref:uncharacterized protein n=1 Tax=Malassezia vespertilionis TaxID=2020962 RepID=UPI0024B1C287|nr:uncharacterized protein MVES1_001018 [Malassezia vespertilionis]WFD05686.1 hypothetical protein MVES1_001018 [Malassezia vespertilionis]
MASPIGRDSYDGAKLHHFERRRIQGVKWSYAVAFVASVTAILAIMLVLAIICKFANPPRAPAQHFAFATSGSLRNGADENRRLSRAQRRGSTVRYPRGSTSQIGLLDQIQPVPVATQYEPRKLPMPPLQPGEKRASRLLPAPPVQQSVGMVPHEIPSYASASSSRPPRILPQPPITDMLSPFRDEGMSPFDSNEALATSHPSRNARGYVPLPDPAAYRNVHSENAYEGYPAQEGSDAYYTDSGPKQQLKGNPSQSSQHSRVESIGAGDYRRHSRKYKGRMSTAERVNVLRATNTDYDNTSESKSNKPPRELPYPPMSNRESEELYTTESAQYPVRDEHQYWGDYDNRRWMQSTNNTGKIYRYNPI